jgi:putative oxidoreductase
MLFWTLDKFVQPDHSARVFENFYGLGGFGGAVFYLIGALELLLILAFVAGLWKRVSYGLVLILHGISTLSSYQQYLDPFNNLLFFAAWPMLAACVTLYLLRDQDTRWALHKEICASEEPAGYP